MKTITLIAVLGLGVLLGCGGDDTVVGATQGPAPPRDNTAPAVGEDAGGQASLPSQPLKDPTPYVLQIPPGFPEMSIPPDNPMTVEGVVLGRQLFFDPILSVDSTKACASCHNFRFAFTDPNRFSEGVAGLTGRNSMPVMNAGWTPALFWDGRAASLEHQALQPVQDRLEMGEQWDHVVEKLKRHADYPPLFEAAFKTRDITSDLVVKAIGQFERTLISSRSGYDRWIAGEVQLTPGESSGLLLFNSEKAECFHCHGTILFTDNRFHNNGLDVAPADSGLAVVTGSPSDLGKFKSPSLRNIEYTAPYMHDGRFKTLEEVVEFYNTGVQRSPTLDPLMQDGRKINFTKEEVESLIAFLKMLSDPDFLQFVPP